VGRAAEDCEEHYFRVYVDTECFPRPRKLEEISADDFKHMVEEKRLACARKVAALKSGIKLPAVKEEEDREEEHTENSSRGTPSVPGLDEEMQPKQPKQPKKLAKLPKTAEDEKTPRQTGNKSLAGAASPSTEGAPLAMAESQQSGYHIKRNEFEIEYDHEAEHLIAELEFGEDDTPEQVQKKLRLIEIYNKRLDEREKRKGFVLSRGLVKVKRQQLIDRRRTSAEKDLVGRLRVLARYMPHPQWEALADGLTVEARLRSRIQELKEYRAMGMKTFEEVDAFIEQGGSKKRESSINNQPGRSKLQRILVDTYALEEEMRKIGANFAADMIRDSHAAVPEGKGVNGMQLWRAKRGVLLDVTSLPDSGPLNEEERRLCANERYLPAQYLAIKSDILRIQDKNGFVTRRDMLELAYAVDQERSLRLLDFFGRMEWITLKGNNSRNPFF
jgi:transcriptional adapter 2-alpha